jgi:branched-chain amino acid transport system substrate-binding protein
VVTTEKGAAAIPQFREGAVAAADWTNQHGGVNGAKLKLHICSTDATPEASISCANDAIDRHVTVDFVAVDLAADASLPKIAQAGIPMVMDFPAGSLTATNPDVRVFYASSPAAIAGPFKYFAGQGAKGLAVVTVDVPAAHQTIPPTADPIAAALKLPNKNIYINTTTPDFNSAILELKSAHADTVFVPLPEGMCSSLVSTAKTLGYTGRLIQSGCTQWVGTDGATADGQFLTSGVYPYNAIATAPTAIKAQLQTYATAMKAAGFGSDVSSGDGVVGYAGFADLVSALQTIPSNSAITASSAKAAIDSAKFMGFTGIPMDCTGTNSVKADKTACTSAIVLLKVTKGGASPTFAPVGQGVYDVGPFLKSAGL